MRGQPTSAAFVHGRSLAYTDMLSGPNLGHSNENRNEFGKSR